MREKIFFFLDLVLIVYLGRIKTSLLRIHGMLIIGYRTEENF